MRYRFCRYVKGMSFSCQKWNSESKGVNFRWGPCEIFMSAPGEGEWSLQRKVHVANQELAAVKYLLNDLNETLFPQRNQNSNPKFWSYLVWYFLLYSRSRVKLCFKSC